MECSAESYQPDATNAPVESAKRDEHGLPELPHRRPDVNAAIHVASFDQGMSFSTPFDPIWP
jgi:hypothetical protein